MYQAFPRFFRYNPSGTVSHKLDAKSDLYIYFYFHGLSLLNPKGAFCFITSNSWLDVGYGKDLQEFTLKHCYIKQIIDNQARRSFASADVNTVICLFSAPEEKRESGLERTARFVAFKSPFEGVLDAVIFEEVEEANERHPTPEHRIFPVSQGDLLKAGSDQTSPQAKYVGDKWSKYLRAPDIYWTIIEKGEDKLVRLGDIAEVRRGFTTGANEFFYLDDRKIQEWGIEEEFLKLAIKSPRECRSLLIDPSQLKFNLFMCGADRADLAGTAALEYIEWGESEGFDQRPSCQGPDTVVGFGCTADSTPFVQLFDIFNSKNPICTGRLLCKRQFPRDPHRFLLGVTFVCLLEFFIVSTDGECGWTFQFWWRSAENSDL